METDDKPKEKFPLQTRIKSTVFKNRKEAIEELVELFELTEDTSDAVFTEYTGMFVKLIADSNPACLEKALIAISIWCDRMNSLAAISEPIEFIKVLAEKVLSQGKSNLT